MPVLLIYQTSGGMSTKKGGFLPPYFVGQSGTPEDFQVLESPLAEDPEALRPTKPPEEFSRQPGGKGRDQPCKMSRP